MNGDSNDADEIIVIVDDGFPWSDSQRRIIAHRDGPLQITACAGSGKTLTISRKIAEMVHNGIDRNSIVAFTFTDNAAEELKVRIRRQMQIVNPDNPVLSRMYIGTIHSFCIELLHEFDSDTLSYDVLDDNKLVAFLSHHYFDIGLHLFEPRHPQNKLKKIRWFAEDIGTLRRELIEDRVRNSNNSNAVEFVIAYDRFLDLLERDHFIDYDGIIYRTVRLLEARPNVLRAVRDKYKYIIVDEYQDVDTLQERLIDILSGGDRNLCVVGDDDQSIYKWRGARINNFIDFSTRYSSPIETLDQNHRSTRLIVDIADNIIRINGDYRIAKDMKCEESFDLGDVYQLYFQNESEEVTFICDKIDDLVGTVYREKNQERVLSYNDFALLFRRKKDMEQIINELEDRDIPFAVRGDESIFGRPESALVRLAFAYLAGGLYPDLTIIDTENSTLSEETRYAVTEDVLRAMIRRSRFLNIMDDQIIADLNTKRQWFLNPTSRRIQPQKLFQEILSSMGIGNLNGSAEAFPEPIMYDLGKISSLLKDFETVYELIFPDQINELVEFLDWAYYHAKSKIDDPTLIDAVNIMTIHAAKGMEFPIVFLPALTTKGFGRTPPISRSFTRSPRYEWIPNDIFSYEAYKENEMDYRRLFYVALTRSKKYLFFTGSHNRVGYSNRQNPSIYYRELEHIGNTNIINERIADPSPRPRGMVAARSEFVYPTSFTDLRYFQKCPYDYKLRKIYGFAPPIDSAFGYGFAVHDILREIHQRFDGTTSILPSPGELRSMVDDRDRFYLRYARGQVEDNLRNEAKEILIDYIGGFGREISLTYKAEEPFEYLIEDDSNEGAALVSGTIDLLQKIDPDTQEIIEVEVIDFKTEHEPDSEFDPHIRDARYQIRLYALATRSEFDIAAVGGYIHYLTERHRVPVNLGDRELTQVETSIKQNVNRIMHRMFLPTPHAEKCVKCDFRRICGHTVTH